MKYWQTMLVILATLSASIVLADDFKTINGKEYKDATVSRVEPDGIVLKTESGISKVYFVELTKEVQEHFHYDPAKAAKASRSETPTPQSTISERENQELLVTIVQVLPQGVLANGAVAIRTASGNIGRFSSQKVFFIEGFTDGLAEGERFQVQAHAAGTYTYQDANGSSRTVEKWVFTKLIQRLDY